ncbi:MAG: transglutaminase family protein [Candidatus Thermoplasmatota archaeon]
MMTPWMMKQREYIPPLIMVQLNLKGLFSLSKILLKNIKQIQQLQQQAKHNVYHRPKPNYTIPSFTSEMKIMKKTEKYLRPTLFCNCEAPEVVALAYHLGAYKKSDREFATAAFEFAKREIILEIHPLDDVVQVLQRGTGTCIHKISVFIALCRAAGIPARYKFYALTILDNWLGPSFERAPLMRQWYDAMGFFMMHGQGEVLIDGKWIPADVGAEPARQAAAGLPITKLGEESIGLWLFPLPGTIMSRESIPLGLGLASQVLMRRVVPNSVAGINIGILEQIEQGKKIIADAGGEQAYDEMARKKRRLRDPTVHLEKKNGILFGDE